MTNTQEVLAKGIFAKWEAMLLTQTIEGEPLTILQLSWTPCDESGEFIEGKVSTRQRLVKAQPRALLVARLFVQGLDESTTIGGLTAKLDGFESQKALEFVECRIR